MISYMFILVLFIHLKPLFSILHISAIHQRPIICVTVFIKIIDLFFIT